MAVAVRGRFTRPVGIGLLIGLGLLATSCIGRGGGEEYPTTPFEQEALEELHRIRDEISALRGLSPNPDTEEGWISARDYREHTEGAFKEVSEDDLEVVDAADVMLKLLGILQPGDSYFDEALDIQSNYIAGFYSFDTDQLVLVGGGGKISRFGRSTLAHEYVHSFQEALTAEHDWETRFQPDDEEEELPYPPSYDYESTLSCVLEGDAEYSELLFRQGDVESWDDYVGDMSWMERNLYFPYSVCLEFIETIHAAGGWDAVNGLYANPPESIEQVMHPEKFHARELPTDLEAADLPVRMAHGWEAHTDKAVFNEFDLWNYVLTVTGDLDLANTAAEGWGMGWISIYNYSDDRDLVLGLVSLQFDSPKDYAEFEAAFGQMLDLMGREGDRRWTNKLGFGSAIWDAANNRVDIVAGTDAASVGAVVQALGDEQPDIAANGSGR